MDVTVHLFGPLSRMAGGSEVTVHVDGSACRSAEILTGLATAVPAIAPALAHCRLAVNHSFATEQQPIAATDEVALIGLVSGG